MTEHEFGGRRIMRFYHGKIPGDKFCKFELVVIKVGRRTWCKILRPVYSALFPGGESRSD